MEKAFGYRKNKRKVKSKFNTNRAPAVSVKSIKRGYSSRGGLTGTPRRVLWLRRFILVAIGVSLLFWQWHNVYAFAQKLARGAYGLLGWGVVLVFVALLIIAGIIRRSALSAFAKRYRLYLWNKCVGAVAIFFGLWGLLGLFDMGGDVGRAIVGDYLFMNVLRVLGLFLLGFIFLAPGLSWRAVQAMARGFAGLFRRPEARTQPVPGAQGSYPGKKTAPAVAAFPPGQQKQTPRPHEGGTIMGGTAPAVRTSANSSYPSSFNQPKSPAALAPLRVNPLPPPRADASPPVRPPAVSQPINIQPVPLAKPPSPLKPQESFPVRSPVLVQAESAATVADKPAKAASPGAEDRAASTVSGEEPTTPAAPQPQEKTRQVAQDVWRKYGQSANLTVVDGWKIPPIEILDKSQEVEFSEADNRQRAKVIEDALGSYGVNAKVVQINVGPTVTQFGLEPGWDIRTKRVQERDEEGNITFRDEEISRTRVKVERITSLSNDLSLALSAPTIRIEAPVPGKPIVGVEVPNKIYSTVSLRGVIETSTFQKILSKSHLAMALGKGAGGEAVSDDLSKMPHLLIAGATGSGKTVCLNAVICCLLMNNTPFDTKLILIDPKRVEMTQFNALPHLATPVIVDTDKALATMRWLNAEMDARYKKLAAAGARNIDGFNKGKTGPDKMPYLVLVIDELADLMMAGFDEVEHILCRLAQLARAVGIHLVVATQRPSVDVITGLIKANFPTRISFAVTSQVDSRTILDMVGAEKLLGRGDMLFAPTEAAKPKRLQGCYVSDPEVERLVYFWNSQKRDDVAPIRIDDLVIASGRKQGPVEDQLMETVRKLAKEHEQISASFLQRKLGIGYPRAARLFDKFKEEMGPNKDGGAEVPAGD